MNEGVKIRWGWLKAMYIYTLVGAGAIGLSMLAMPGRLQSMLGFPAQDPATFKLYGSILLGSGLSAVPALRFPLKFLALLLIQVIYKPVWIALAALPVFLKGQFPPYIVVITIVFLAYIVGDIIAIPWAYLFSRAEKTAAG